eukprot:5719389-Lingulodinium_polyedra.AAC.1
MADLMDNMTVCRLKAKFWSLLTRVVLLALVLQQGAPLWFHHVPPCAHCVHPSSQYIEASGVLTIRMTIPHVAIVRSSSWSYNFFECG